MKFVYDDGGRSKYFRASDVGDCGVRAVANATGKDYKEVYDDLKALNKGKSCRDGTPRKVMQKYMEKIGWEWHPTMGIGTGCQVHLRADELPSGDMVLSLSGHFSCVKDGVLYDTYDCSRDGTRCVYGYWMKSTEQERVEFLENISQLTFENIIKKHLKKAFEEVAKITKTPKEKFLEQYSDKVESISEDLGETINDELLEVAM